MSPAVLAAISELEDSGDDDKLATEPPSPTFQEWVAALCSEDSLEQGGGTAESVDTGLGSD